MLRRKIILVLAGTIAAVGIYACWPRQADLRRFDPAEMARLETAMWRDYYEKRWQKMTEQGWMTIESQLRLAYERLRAGIGGA
jgi:hypothetical protein